MLTDLARARAFITVSGNSGVGKTSLVDALVSGPLSILKRPISVTTRARRPFEANDEYKFVTKEQFDSLDESGALINRDHVHGNLYGITRASVAELHASGVIPIKEVHSANLHKLRRAGFLVLSAKILTAPHDEEAASYHERDIRGRVNTPDDISTSGNDGYALVLNRSDGNPDRLAQTVRSWLAATDYLHGAAPKLLRAACNPEIDNQTGYDEIASDFDDSKRVTTSFFHKITLPFWSKVFGTKVHSDGRYLEIGPGSGWLKNTAWPHGVKYRGLEISEQMRVKAISSENISLGVANCLCEPTSSLDGVFGSLADPYLLPNFMIECRRALKDEGLFAGTSPAREWAERFRDANRIAETEFISTIGNKCRVASFCYTSEQIETLLKIAGFAHIEMRTICVDRSELSSTPPAIAAAFAKDSRLSRLPVMHQWIALISKE